MFEHTSICKVTYIISKMISWKTLKKLYDSDDPEYGRRAVVFGSLPG